MAAKVVMVAVPTVLGIASIRVYTVSEVSTDGLVTREKLNIYTPLPQSAQAQFVPESPGVIQSGLTTARESIRPFVQSVKGACVSVKTGTVNLYHTGEDVFYYLKDPPPGFLPRFGTITMAGLLGMFLARRGSHFKRLAVPLGLMTAGASVCYPAQTVSVFKVTGKKVYAVGQWSSAAVSSLLASKPQEPNTKEIAASQPQTATVPNPESAAVEEPSSAQSPTITETEVGSAGSVPVSDEPVVAVTAEEASSLTLTEISPDQTPTETSTDAVAHSVSAGTETTTTPEEIPAPVEHEEPSDTKQAAQDVSSEASPAEPTPSLEPETVEAAPVEVAPVEEVTAVEVAPVEEVTVVEVTAVEVAPVEAAPVEAAPEEAAPEEAAPVEAAPVEEVTAVEAPPVEATAPVDEAASVVEAAPVESAQEVESAPVETAPVEAIPSSEEPPAPKASEEPAVPFVESAEPEPKIADPPQETPTPTLTPPENSKGGSSFKPDPALMDFGQSSPEDEDLYSTRS